MNYDYIVAGAGLGGLSFIHQLLRSGLPFDRVLLLDREPKTSNDRTWSFWSTSTPEYACAKTRAWDSLGFASDHHVRYEAIAPYRYYSINGLEFYKEINQLIDADTRITRLETDISNMLDHSDRVEVTTSNGVFTGHTVIDSIHRPDIHTGDCTSVSQSFLGWVIKSKQAVFVPDKPLLMDFRLPQKEACCFAYVLPYSAHEGLVEYTQFTSQWSIDRTYYRHQLKQYIQAYWCADPFDIVHEEVGQIPMTNFAFDHHPSPNVYRVGTAGGDTKPTTGYTFTNVQRHVKQILGLKPATDGSPVSRFDHYDTLLLQIIAQHPTKVKSIMEYLFKNQPMSRVLKFLNEETHPLEEMLIFGQLPWLPFLTSLSQRIRYGLSL